MPKYVVMISFKTKLCSGSSAKDFPLTEEKETENEATEELTAT